MPQQILEYSDIAGKVVEKVTVVNEEDHRLISIHFTDKTRFWFQIYTRVEIEPEFVDLKTGNVRTIKTYPLVTEPRYD
jgi:hypothetical protein